ncbi:MAG: hypothetical protein PHS73_03225 [Candidatus Peribacteraceae bacterium]|nr:hypothetical protein [Candidatus Peribacteraceae bacterium]
MRSSLLISLLLAGVLASCGPTIREQGLPAEEVMRLAAQKSGELQSARFAIVADYRTQGVSFPSAGTAKLNGVLQDGGGTVQCILDVDALVSTGSDDAQTFRLLGNADIILLPAQETYLRLNTLRTDPEQNLFHAQLLNLFVGQWWVFPAREGVSAVLAGGTITPSPNLLKAQSQVVRVKRDDGLTILDGRRVYHVLVEADPVKLLAYLEQVSRERQEPFDRSAVARTLERLQADGELWVDAETFFLHRVSWDVESLEEEGGMIISGSFTVNLSDHNAAPPVTPPADAKLLSPQMLFGEGVLPEGQAAMLPAEDNFLSLRSLVSSRLPVPPSS